MSDIKDIKTEIIAAKNDLAKAKDSEDREMIIIYEKKLTVLLEKENILLTQSKF